MIKNLLIFILLLPSLCGAATFYVKEDGNDALSGTSDATAWKTINKVNGYPFGPGDDVYFKCDDTWTNERVIIDWSGTAGDSVTIGAYYGSGTIGVSGAKPTISGTQNSYPPKWTGLVEVTGDYVEVKNLSVTNSDGYGVHFSGANNSTADAVDVNWTDTGGIVAQNGSYITVKNSTVTAAGQAFEQDSSATWGAAIAFSSSPNGTVQNCKVHENYGEGINFHTNSDDGLAEYNLVYDNRAVQMYIDGNSGCAYRYNLIYGTTNTEFHRYGAFSSNGIFVADEQWDGDQNSGNNTVHNNFVANCYRGIFVGNNVDATNLLFYNNTIVGCGTGLGLLSNTFSGCEFKNNIILGDVSTSYMYTGPTSPSGFTADYNYWSLAGGLAGANDASGYLGLSKMTGWNSITAGSITVTDFGLASGSVAINAGDDLGASYDDAIDTANTDYTASPPSVTTLDQDNYGAGWEIGAAIFTSGVVVEDPTGWIQTGYSTEVDVRTVAGNLRFTLNNATFNADIATDSASATAMAAAINSAGSIDDDTTSWNDVVSVDYSDFTLTASNILDVSISAQPTYDIAENEAVDISIPSTSTSAGAAIPCDRFYISAITPNTTAASVSGGGSATWKYSSTGRSIRRAP